MSLGIFSDKPNLYGFMSEKKIRQQYGAEDEFKEWLAHQLRIEYPENRTLTCASVQSISHDLVSGAEVRSPRSELSYPAIKDCDNIIVPGGVGMTREVVLSTFMNVIVSSKSEYVIKDDIAIFDRSPEESRHYRVNPQVNPFVVSGDEKTITVIQDQAAQPQMISRAISLTGVHSYNYGHWIDEYLPKLLALRAGELECTSVLVDRQMPSQHFSLLHKLLAGSGADVVVLEPGERVAVRQLYYVTSHLYYPAGVEPESLNHSDHLKSVIDVDFYLNSLDRFPLGIKPSYNPPKRVYITRKGLSKSMANAEKIETYFLSLGFVVCDFYQLSIDDQLNIFQRSDVIVGPEGSAFANVVFSRPSQIIVQFVSPCLYGNERMAQICERRKVCLRFVKGDYVGEPAGYFTHHSYRINLDEVKRIMENLLVV